MRFNSIKYIALLVLAAATLAGCTKAPAPDLGEELNVLLQMSVGTKAVTETDGTPTAAESAIHTLRVYAFVDGKAAGHFYTPDYAALEDAAGTASGTAKHFLMDIKMYSLGTKDVDFYVVANEGAMYTAGSAARLDENTTEAELKGFTFTSLNLGNGMALGLPMCCKKTETIDFADDDSNNPQTVPGHEGHTLLAQKLSFELERPVGKIGVFAAKPKGEKGTLTITGLSVTRSRFVNFLMPPADLEDAYDNEGSQAAPRDLEIVGGSVTAEVASGETDASEYTPVQAEAYYPFENPWGSSNWSVAGSPRGNILTIRYKYEYDTDSQERTGTVYLPPIERNTYYMVCCRLSNSGKIMVNYSVADWDDSEPYKLEFAAPEYELPTQSYPAVAVQPPYSDQPTVHYNGDPAAQEGTFSINFKISGPVGQVWTPTLLNATDADYQITVTQNGSPVAAPYLASADPYEITIRALRPDNVGKMLEFAISYTPQWDPTGTSLLMINGNSETALHWPVPDGTENPTYKIVIKQD